MLKNIIIRRMIIMSDHGLFKKFKLFIFFIIYNITNIINIITIIIC